MGEGVVDDTAVNVLAGNKDRKLYGKMGNEVSFSALDYRIKLFNLSEQ